MFYQITFPADYKNVPPLRDLAFHVALLSEFSKDKAEHLKSVVDELCNNAIEYGSQPTSEVCLELFADPKIFKIMVLDQGHGNKMKAMDLKKKIDESIDQTAGRGRGVGMIVKSFVSELDFRDREGGGIIATAILHKQ